MMQFIPGLPSIRAIRVNQARRGSKAVLAGLLCVAAHAHASSVVMMIGGVKNAKHASAIAQKSVPASTVEIAQPERKMSVVTSYSASGPSLSTFSPGALFASAPSGSVSSRVTALTPLIADVAHAAQIDSALLMAVIDVESGGNPQAISPKGATGLMQLMPATGSRHGAVNLFDPRQNIMAGARYLRKLMQQFGKVELALAAYNAGEGAVMKYGMQIPPYNETMAYVPKVLGRYQHYRLSSAIPAHVAPESRQGHFIQVRQTLNAESGKR
ncbi:lytic transglycosylase domain-containing protein [Paraburkholderia hayleyella]|uniref:lytic transglycosylase domain-containing protein n=1 Tax=Paraburkholderia hayleyella TaxID=2152889 RepID=UPI001FE5F6EC|nr:lytic transglycosylase domain-containing protein [Paraburkholderia hayleyella]